jgi:hypothetical protein
MNAVRITLIVLDAFVALTAIGGGIALATGLEGQRYPVEWLRHTPFRSYVIPGLILAVVVVGGSAAVAAVVTLARPEVGAGRSMLAGAILMGQIIGEILLLRRPVSRIEVVYFAVGSAMLLLGLTLWRVPVDQVPPLASVSRLTRSVAGS